MDAAMLRRGWTLPPVVMACALISLAGPLLPLLSDYLATHADAGLRILGFSLDTREELTEVRRVAQSLRFPVGLMSESSAPGYGRIWRLPVSFTIDRQGLLAADGWKEKKPAWTRERLDQLVTPLLASG